MNNQCINLLAEIPDDADTASLIKWVRYVAGSSNQAYFKCEKAGDLKLQQVPEEYANILIKTQMRKPQSYLEVGIGNGGSWMTFSYFNRKTLKISHAVDNLSYYQAIGQKIQEIDYIKDYLSQDIEDVQFNNMDSKAYLSDCIYKYDVIFIDGDHSYEGVKTDYQHALPLMNDNGIMIFHDIASVGAPGVVNFWKEIKTQHRHEEFIFSNTCGMGLIYL